MQRRSEQRHRTIFRPAYVKAESGIHFALMRNVSPTGARLSIFGDFTIGELLEYNVANSGPVTSRVVWSEGTDVGVENCEPTDDLSFCGGLPYRSVRLPISAEAVLHTARFSQKCILSNLSQNGACIECSAHLTPGALITLEVVGMQFELATVQWSDENRVGVRFASALEKTKMAELLDRIQKRYSSTAQVA